MYMIARIYGRGFTRLTKEVHQFETPFDEKFRNLMIETVKHLMNCGFSIIYDYTQSDEISLLFHPNENLFGRKTRKYISVLAGEASAKFSSIFGDVGAFDCRISELPNRRLVEDYFRWRSEDAHRNALNAYCYWQLRKDNHSRNQASSKIKGMSIAAKNELLFQYGINFNNLPAWQKRGIGFYWKNIKKEGFNPETNEYVFADKRVLYTDLELPIWEEYNKFIFDFLEQEPLSSSIFITK
ncbi:tRNA(His) guanylyltransferase Thg1 family protein [Pedobacter sp. SG908]|uniref:tRNA(His) guanylyltransferase Thg1 family protein n=1 Tax=Pedobacter sp. SG908 TaxID=2587135 RepID=UPI0032669BA2